MKGRILILENAQLLRDSLCAILGEGGNQTITADDLTQALNKARDGQVDLVIAGVDSAGVPVADMLRELREISPDLPVVIISDVTGANSAIEATRMGAYGFVQTPIDPEQLRLLAMRAVEYCQLVRENRALRVGAVSDALAGKPLAEIEKQVILSTLERFKGHRMRTATSLGIGLRTLGMKLKRWREEGQLIESK